LVCYHYNSNDNWVQCNRMLFDLQLKKIILISRYKGRVDQDFYDLEEARWKHEEQIENDFNKEELTRLILTGHGEYYNKM